jgi:hypothetical protein
MWNQNAANQWRGILELIGTIAVLTGSWLALWTYLKG